MLSILYVQFMKFEESVPYLLLISIFQKRAPCFVLFNYALVSFLVGLFSFVQTHVIKISRCIDVCHLYFKMQFAYLKLIQNV